MATRNPTPRSAAAVAAADGALVKAVRSGWRTSEFWVTVAWLLAPVLADLAHPSVADWGAAHGWAGGIVVAAYVAARAYLKALAAKIATDPIYDLPPLQPYPYGSGATGAPAGSRQPPALETRGPDSLASDTAPGEANSGEPRRPTPPDLSRLFPRD